VTGSWGDSGPPAQVLARIAQAVERGEIADDRCLRTLTALLRQAHDLALPPTGFNGMVEVRVDCGTWIQVTVRGSI